MRIHSATLCRDLAELNEGFLELVAQGPDVGFSPTVHARLAAFGRKPRRRLAGVAFALFGFGFQEEAAWAPLLSPGVRDLERVYAARDPAVECFTLLALSALRGFMRTAPRRVSAWIGLPPETGVQLAALEIGALGPVAMLAAPRLRGRLAPRASLWHRFIDAAERGDERQLAVLAALGQQWTIRRSLRLEPPGSPVSRAFRR